MKDLKKLKKHLVEVEALNQAQKMLQDEKTPKSTTPIEKFIDEWVSTSFSIDVTHKIDFGSQMHKS